MAYEDLQSPLPAPEKVVESLCRLRATDGGFVNAAGEDIGLTPTTAAVATVLRSLGAEIPDGLAAWLLQRHRPDGGFCAVPNVPFADLLSTATALQALSSMGTPLDAIREPCAAFVESLWHDSGAFAGSWVDPTPDCEYTFYGLLALGHLAP
jgi:prenyltransferase beta subunit